MTLKIGYLVPEFPSQTHIIFWREITQLREMGFPVLLYSTRRPPPGSCPHEFAAPAEAETRYTFPPAAGTAFTLATRPVRALRALRYVAGLGESSVKDRLKRLGLVACAAGLARAALSQGVDHLHVQSCAEAAHLAALCRILGGPRYSLTLHGDLPVYGTDHRSKMKGASFIMVVGQHLKDQVVREVGIEPDRIVSTFLGIDTEKFHDSGRRAYLPRRIHVVSVGRINRAKGYRHSLAAIRAALDHGIDVSYTIVGEGPDRPSVDAEIARLGLAEKVRLAGAQSEDTVAELLQESDVFLLSSVGAGEAYPSVIIEAMASGLPVVSSRIGATPEMMTHGANGLLVTQGDEAALTDALVMLAEHPDERRRLGEAARLRARDVYDRRVSTTRLLENIRAFSGSNGTGA
jgi:colanic acid/amylovoran biosynthesis glycosyltransferase